MLTAINLTNVLKEYKSMRHLGKSFLVGAALASILAVPAAAAPTAQTGVPGGPFASAFRVQNLGGAAAACSYVIYNDNGTTAFNTNLPSINPNDSAYVHTPAVSGFPTGTFAGVVSCNQPVAAVVNFSDPSKGDSYVGSSNPAATLFVPSAYRNYYNYYTSIRLQNTSSSAQNVTIEYYAPGATAAAATRTINLAGNGAATVDQLAEPVDKLRQNVSYSARITGSAPLAATVSIFGGSGTSVAKELYSYSAFAGGSTSPIYAPVVMRNYYGYNTSTTIQNVGSAEANVRLTYSNGKVRNDLKIPANSSLVVYDFQDESLQRNVLYGSKIESTNGQPLIVIVNESTPTTSRASTYEGIAAGGRTLVAPIVMKRYYEYNSSVTCQNIGDVPTNVRVSYSGTNIANKTVLTNLGPGQSDLILQPADAQLADRYIGSATITADQDIVCVVNQDKTEGTPARQVMDQLYAYNAVVKQ
jgi:hypothetical protein